MKQTKKHIDFNSVFILGTEISTCPLCGSRTDMILDLSHTNQSVQVHNCLECSYEFVLVEDEDLLGYTYDCKNKFE